MAFWFAQSVTSAPIAEDRLDTFTGNLAGAVVLRVGPTREFTTFDAAWDYIDSHIALPKQDIYIILDAGTYYLSRTSGFDNWQTGTQYVAKNASIHIIGDWSAPTVPILTIPATGTNSILEVFGFRNCTVEIYNINFDSTSAGYTLGYGHSLISAVNSSLHLGYCTMKQWYRELSLTNSNVSCQNIVFDKASQEWSESPVLLQDSVTGNFTGCSLINKWSASTPMFLRMGKNSSIYVDSTTPGLESLTNTPDSSNNLVYSDTNWELTGKKVTIRASSFATAGDSQISSYHLRRVTSNTTATYLTSDGAVQSSTNIPILPDNSIWALNILITARDIATNDGACWAITGSVKRGSGAATVAVSSFPTTPIYSDPGASSWGVNLVANTTLGGFSITAVGEAATTIRWTCRIDTTEVA